ncbi:IS1096 element passenger TnpR family protein [Paenarthrobacter sp. 22069]|uniref:IS1096 element passenger TnpR family protein n=1 Tax=Paenarthrobacter sp. 22069 TaxID=3453864 RepID=UPI003F832368
MGCVGTSGVGVGFGQDAFLQIRGELFDSDPGIRRRLEIRSTVKLDRVHQVLQASFGREDAHLHKFTTSPFAPLRFVDGEFPEVP